jgi:transposase
MKRFKDPPGNRHQICFLPPVLDDVVPQDAFVRRLSDIMDGLDVGVLMANYPGGGAPSYDPRMLLKLLLFAYSEGVRSSRRIAERCQRDTYYMFLTLMSQPDFHTICRFRRRNEAAIRQLMQQTVVLCMEAGLVLLEHVAVDGTKLTADVSSKETYNEKRVQTAIEYSQACIDAILKEAEAEDAADERQSGGNDDNEPPGEQSNHKKSAVVEKLERRKARAELAQQAMLKNHEKTVCATDLEARVMNTNGLNRPAYNAQAAVDGANHIIVAAVITRDVVDMQQIPSVVAHVVENTGIMPSVVTADSGYSSFETLDYLDRMGIDGHVAERKHQKVRAEYTYDAKNDVFHRITEDGEEIVMRFHRVRTDDGKSYRIYRHTQADKEQLSNDPSDKKKADKEMWLREDVERDVALRQAMHAKLTSPQGKATYSLRQQTAEPVFGHIKTVMNMRRLLLRKMSGAAIEFLLACSAHNLMKLVSAGKPKPTPRPRLKRVLPTQMMMFEAIFGPLAPETMSPRPAFKPFWIRSCYWLPKIGMHFGKMVTF